MRCIKVYFCLSIRDKSSAMSQPYHFFINQVDRQKRSYIERRVTYINDSYPIQCLSQRIILSRNATPFKLTYLHALLLRNNIMWGSCWENSIYIYFLQTVDFIVGNEFCEHTGWLFIIICKRYLIWIIVHILINSIVTAGNVSYSIIDYSISQNN